MTTVVSRLYDSVEKANGVADQLRADGFPDAYLSVITDPDAEKMKEARVNAAAAEAYSAQMKAGQAVFVCRAPFTPFGAARRAIEVADGTDWIDAGVGASNDNQPDEMTLDTRPSSILEDHPLMLTRDYVGSGWSEWKLSDVFDIPLLTARRERSPSVLEGAPYMSKKFWPGPLLSNKPRKNSVIEGGRHMIPFGGLLTSHKQGKSVLEDHPKFSERLGIKTIIEKR
jgi:hypothetical protein